MNFVQAVALVALFAAAGYPQHTSEACPLLSNWARARFCLRFTASALLSSKQAIHSDDFDTAPLGALFREAKLHLSLDFTDASVESCPRECNRPAHELAALGAGQVHGDHTLWLTNCPDVL